ncbi:RCC1 domain-containing protein [Acetivibrio cellulolyticus]|uniref:RCC1 domain-containing protein n=1 Tax=Acetivibrio cellulolyticus TaxID=35830 RepID=UPI0001E2C714|nr:S-layer homology domain-containing protein [Acetivibrio cellulolyticus]
MFKLKNFICIILLVALAIGPLSNNYIEVLAESDSTKALSAESELPSIKLNKWKEVYSAGRICIGLLDDDSLWEWCTHTDSLYTLRQDKFKYPIKMLENISDVSIGQGHILALTKDNILWAWGTNSLGELGDGSGKNNSKPQIIMNDVLQICTGKDSTSSFAIRSDGSLWGWGNNVYGQLGDSTSAIKTTPVKIMENVRSVVCGERHTLAIKNDNSLWAWGDNTDGQLGNETYTKSYTPVKIMEDVSSIAVDYTSCFAVKTDYTLWSWGNNLNGQLGDGQNLTKRNKPKMILGNVFTVTAAPQSAYAITLDKSLYSWGSNSGVLLGDKRSENKFSPVKVMDNISKVSAYDHVMALDENGLVWGWGYNDYYQLGNSKDSVILTPTLLSDNVSEISTDYNTSSYITSDGSLFQLGDLDGINCSTPQNIPVQPYIDNITVSGNLMNIQFSGAPLNSISESDFNITRITNTPETETVTENVYASVYSFDQNTNIAILELPDLASYNPYSFISYIVSYKGHLEVTTNEIPALPTASPLSTPYSPMPASTPTYIPVSTPIHTTSSYTPEPPTPASTSTFTPISSSTSKSTSTTTNTNRNTPAPTVIQPLQTIPGPNPQETSKDTDADYKKMMGDFQENIAEIIKRYEGVYDPYNEKNELITTEAEKTIEKIATQKVICETGIVELEQELILPQSELASRAKKDVEEFLETQPYEPNRIIRKRINIDVELIDNGLNINVLKDIVPLMKAEMDVKISSKFGNIILYYENIEAQLNKDLKIYMTNEKTEPANTKIKSKVNLLFKYTDGTIIEKLNCKIGLELPYGDGNPDYCAIYYESNENSSGQQKAIDTKSASAPYNLIRQDQKIELGLPYGNRKQEYCTEYAASTTKMYNMGGHEDTQNKTLRVSTTSSGNYHVIEGKKTFTDIGNEDPTTKKAIEVLSSKGILNGKDDGIFDPAGKLKRSEFVCLLIKVLNLIDEDAHTDFIDVPVTAWYYNPVAIADNEDLISGYPGNKFLGNNSINNQEIIKTCAVTLQTEKGYYLPKDENNLLIYKDNADIQKWARKYVSLGTREGLVVKRADGKFNATTPCTRRDAAVILYRLYNKL